MLILPDHLVKKIDENRGDLSQSEFLELLIASALKAVGEEPRKKEEGAPEQQYVTQEALRDFEGDIKELIRNFLDFVVTYGLEMGKGSGKNDLDKLSQRLKEL